jgi:cytoskeleton protein RodZ
MIDLGNELRQAREAKGISLTEAEADTRIKEYYLKALEINDWAALPTPVQAQGFLRNYAIYLGLDEEQVMARFGKAARGPAATLPPSPALETKTRTADEGGAVFRPRDIDIERDSGLPGWLSSDIFVGVTLALIVIVVGWGLLQFFADDSDGATPVTVTPTTAFLVPVMTDNTPQPTVATAAPSEATTPSFDASMGTVQLTLEATEHVWVRVTVDGAIVLEGILAPELSQTWQGTQQIKLETANGAGLKAVVNGQSIAPLGERGETVVMTWDPSGLLSPAPDAGP